MIIPKAKLKIILVCLITSCVQARIENNGGQETLLTVQSAPQQKPDDSMYRLIVRFKNIDERSPYIPAGSHEEKIHQIDASTPYHGYGLGVNQLNFLKSIGEKEAVIATDRATSRRALEVLAEQIKQNPRVESVVLDEKVSSLYVPSDAYYSNQWYMGTSYAGAANVQANFDRIINNYTQQNVQSGRVAVLDTGSTNHADFSSNLIPGYDFISDLVSARDGDGWDANSNDEGNWNDDPQRCSTSSSSWHGTSVMGLIASKLDNGGIAGVSPKSHIQMLRVSGSCGGYDSDVIAAMRYAAGIPIPNPPSVDLLNPTPVSIINISLGSVATCNTAYAEAIRDVLARDVSIVVASGNNSSTNTLTRPANCDGVISVTSHDESGLRPQFANIGVGTAISAPGVRISVDANTGSTVQQGDGISVATPNISGGKNGTSFSAPLVTGTLAEMKHAQPALSVRELRSYLLNATKEFPTGNTDCYQQYICGAGMLDTATAISYAVSAQRPVTEIIANTDIHATARDTDVTLTGYAQAGRNAYGPITGVQWTQLAGPAVTLSTPVTVNEGTSPGTAQYPIKKSTTTFHVPVSSAGTRLVFQFRAMSYMDGASTGIIAMDLVANSAGGGANGVSGGGSGGSSGGGGAVSAPQGAAKGGGWEPWDAGFLLLIGVSLMLLRRPKSSVTR